MKNDNQDIERTPDAGIFVTEGMNISIPSFPIKIGDDENIEIESEPLILHTGLDMCLYWLDIALGNWQQIPHPSC